MIRFFKFDWRGLLLAAQFTAALLLVSCKNEEGQNGVIGRVTAEEGSPANAIVKIYNRPVSFDVNDDASVWSVTGDEDAVGFPLDLAATFDHRLFNPAFVDTADGDGNFQFESIVGGNYIIVAEKLGQGWSVPRELNTTGSDMDIGELRLPKVIRFPDNLFRFPTDTTFRSGVHYIVPNNMTVSAGRSLTIEPGAVVLMQGNKSLNIEGTLICRGTPQNYIRFMPADVIARDPDEWQQLTFEDGASPPDLAYVSFRNGDVAIDTEAGGGLIENCYFFRFAYGILAEGEPPVLRRCVFERVDTGCRTTSTSGFVCEHNIFQTSDPFALVLYNMDDCEIFCNWFRDCGGSDTSGSGTRGVIRLDLVSETEIHGNHFETSWFALAVGSHVDSTVQIHHNEFTRMNTVMNIGVTEDQRGPSNPRFNYNCLSTIDRFVINVNCNQHNTQNVDATNNSWGTISLAQIKDRYIHDRDDDGTCPVVFLTPLLNSSNDVLMQTGTRCGICP
ncbi:hypothetical protein HUU59_01125 [bacterium]|nr:hypothetical protein [bacterium]